MFLERPEWCKCLEGLEGFEALKPLERFKPREYRASSFGESDALSALIPNYFILEPSEMLPIEAIDVFIVQICNRLAGEGINGRIVIPIHVGHRIALGVE